MPDEAIINENQNQITYNVVLDPGDIARQAQEIRDQLDLALGVGSNAGAQFINTTQFINPQFAPLPPADMTGFGGQFGGTFDQSFWNRAKDQVSDTYNNFGTTLDKIQQDISRMLDRVTTTIQGFQPEPTPYNPYEGMLPDTFGEKLLASIGFGGDPEGPIAPSVYQRYGRERLKEDISDILQNPGDFYDEVTSTPIGMIASLGAFIAAPYAMLGVEAAMLGDQFLSGAYNKREDLAGGIQEIARQEFGNISKTEARDVAQDVLEYVNSYEGYAKDIPLDEVSQNILQFANEGGFAGTRNVEEMRDRVTTVVEDTRQIARNLGIFQEEAISIMAELQQKSMVNVEEMRNLTTSMRFYGGVLKQEPTELLMGAVQTAEQFRQRGSYLTPEMAMQAHVDANIEAQRLIQSTDPYIQSSVYRMGGQQGTAQGLLGAYDTFQTSAFGEFINMNQYVNPEGGGDIGNVMKGIGGGFQTLEDISNYYGRGREEVKRTKGLRESAYDLVEVATSLYERLNGGESPESFETLEGFMQLPGMENYFGNLTPDQIRAAIETVKLDVVAASEGKDPRRKLKSGEIYTALKAAEENTETTVFGTIGAEIMKPIDDFWRNLSYEYGESKERKLDWFHTVERDFDEFFGTEDLTTWMYGLFYTPKYSIDTYGNTEGTFTEGGVVITDFQNSFIRRQVGLGRDSRIGIEVSEARTAELQQEAINYLQDQGVTITDVEDLTTETNQNLLKEAKLDIEGIRNEVNIMWGEDTFITDDEKFAVKMWGTKEVANPRAEEYYKAQIEDTIANDIKSFQDEKGELMPLSEMVDKIDAMTLETSPYKNMPEADRKRIIWQAMDRQTEEKFEEKMVNEPEAKVLGTTSLDRIKRGDVERTEQFKEASSRLRSEITEERKALINRIGEGREDLNLSPRTDTTLNEAIGQALVDVQSMQGTPQELEIRFMEQVEKNYEMKREVALDEKGPEYGTIRNFDEDIKNYVTETYFTGSGGGEMKRYAEAISTKSTLEPMRAIFEVVTKELANIEKAGDLGMGAYEVAGAIYDIIPGLASMGKVNLSDINSEGIKELIETYKNIDHYKDYQLTERAEILADKFGLGEASQKELEENLKNLQVDKVQDIDDKNIGANTQTIRNYVEASYWVSRETLTFGQKQRLERGRMVGDVEY